MFWLTKQKVSERKARFQHVMDVAHEICTRDPMGLGALLRLVASPLQVRTITASVHVAPHKARRHQQFHEFFFRDTLPISSDGKSAREIAPRRTDQRYRLRLGTDPVLAVPWHRNRLATALATIGFAKSKGAWRKDPNHSVCVLLPLGIGIVSSGNHSLTAGIVNGEGYVDSSEVQDLVPLYSHVKYDGNAFVRSHNGTILSEPVDEEPGMLFEIGRLMIEHNVSPEVDLQNECSVEAIARPIDNGLYLVYLDGKDSGIAVTPSGAERTLHQAGLSTGTLEWSQALHNAAPFSRKNPKGKIEMVNLVWKVRRQELNDLSRFSEVDPWIKNNVN